jgi:hypothetical protein
MPTKMDGSEWPTVLLPSTITEDQLRQLVTACPNFDADQTTKLKDWFKDNPTATSMPDDYLPEPSIQFDGSDAYYTMHDPDWTPSPEDQAKMERLNKLSEILYKASNDFFETYQPDGKDGGTTVVTASESPAEGQ